MRRPEPFVLVIPKPYYDELERLLIADTPQWGYSVEYFWYVAAYLIREDIKHRNRGFHSLNTKKMTKSIVWNIGSYIGYLRNGELLECDDHYIVGEKSKAYRINPRFCGDEVVEVKVRPGSHLHTRMVVQERLKRKHFDRMPDYLVQMKDLLMTIELDYEGAKAWILGHGGKNKAVYLTALGHIQDKRFRYFSRNKTNNRLDTNLTNLVKGVRPFLIGDWVSIDLANSQPLFLSLGLHKILTSYLPLHTNHYYTPLCDRHNKTGGPFTLGKQQLAAFYKIPQNLQDRLNGEVIAFLDTCINGRFYESFQELAGGSRLTRVEVKDMLFAVMYSKNEEYRKFTRFIPYEREKKLFANVYPAIAEVLKILKMKDHKKLAIALQRQESDTFIDRICPVLIDFGVVPLTIHDSILVPATEAETALNACTDVFMDLYGIRPTFHVEPLNKERKMDNDQE